MNLLIDENRSLESVINDFRRHFPYLKLEFYSKAHETGKGSEPKYQFRHDLLIKDAHNNSKSGLIHIDPEMTVKDLESLFEEIFGLYIQVFRLSGKLWLQTTVTDNLSLTEQNRLAMNMEQKIDRDEPVDYQEQG